MSEGIRGFESLPIRFVCSSPTGLRLWRALCGVGPFYHTYLF